MIGLAFLILELVALFSVPARAANLAEIVAQMPPGTWYELPNTRLDGVFPLREGHPAWGVSGPSSVVSDWGGAAFDPIRNWFIVTGGGHAAYGGNEVYVFDLETLAWRRLTEPSQYETDPAYGNEWTPGNFVRTLDGSPISSHTYDGLQYLPGLDKVFMFGGSQWRAGINYDHHAYLLDLASATWQRKARAPTYSLEVASAWDTKRQRVLVVTKTGVMAYNPAADTWANVAGNWYYQVDRVAEYDPVHDRLLLIGSKDNKKPIAYLQLGGKDLTTAPLSGAMDVPLWRPGLTYDSAHDLFVVWGGDRATWAIHPDSWVATKFDNPLGDAPAAKNLDGTVKNHGTYSRWHYVPAYDVFIALNSAHDNVWLYKMAGAEAPPPPVIEPEPPVIEPPTPPTLPEPVPPSECAADLCVGPQFALKKPSEAAKKAQEGDLIFIEGGEYTDCATWPVSVTIRGIHGRPLVGNKTCGSKAIWIVQGARTEVENVELVGAWAGSGNAAAIRHEGEALVVRNALIHGNQNGILTNHGPQISLEVYDSEFYGQKSIGDLGHSIYAAKIGRTVVEGSYFHHGASGHFIKTLAAENRIAYNRLVDLKGIDAALIDVWGCSDFTVVGNAMVRPGRYGTLTFIQAGQRKNQQADGKWIAEPCPEARTLKGLIAYNSAFFANDLKDDTRWSALYHHKFPVPVTVANNLGVHVRHIVLDGGSFKRSGGVQTGNVHIWGWQPELFADYQAGDLRLTQPLPEPAVPIDYVPHREPLCPVGTRTRIGAMTVGAFAARN